MSEVIAKANRVQKLMEDEDLQQAFDDVENAIVRGWKQAKPTDHEAKEEWHRRLFTLESVKANLRQAISDGKLEDFRSKQETKPSILGDLSKWQRKQ